MDQKVFPRCKSDFKNDYVSADGYVMPCCWLGNYPAVLDYFDIYKDCLAEMNIKNRPLDDILKDAKFLRIEATWFTSEPLNACTMFCGKPIENAGAYVGQDQFIEVYSNIPTLEK